MNGHAAKDSAKESKLVDSQVDSANVHRRIRGGIIASVIVALIVGPLLGLYGIALVQGSGATLDYWEMTGLVFQLLFALALVCVIAFVFGARVATH